ncbi:MAG: CvpA family protein [Lachnospiraceae bacterium]|nr:CvpA family protein [Lachnospiraceae bacterium]
MTLLICMIIILAGCMLLGYHKGFILILFSLLATVLTVVLTIGLTPMVSSMIRKSPVYDKVYDSVYEKMGEAKLPSDKNSDLEGALIDFKMPKEISKFINSNNTEAAYEKLGVTSPREYVSGMLANIVINAIVFILLFIIIYVLVNVIVNALDLLSKLPVINTINKSFGVVIGLAEGILIIWVVLLAVTFLQGTAAADFVNAQVEENAITAFVYNNNLLLKYIMNIIKVG